MVMAEVDKGAEDVIMMAEAKVENVGNIALHSYNIEERIAFQEQMVKLTSKKLYADMCLGENGTNNADLLMNTRWYKTGEDLTVVTNGGSKYFNQVGDMMLFPLQLHLNEDSMANIISFTAMANVLGVQITMDTEQERAITVQYEGKKFKFKEYSEGLYHYDTAQGHGGEQINDNPGALNFLVQTMKDNKTCFMKHEIKGGEEAHCIQ
eukprot:15365322-Ditylum_brightwellii.AAC.1